MEGAVLEAPDHPRLQANGSALTLAQPSPHAKADRWTLYQPEFITFPGFGSRAYTHWTDSELNSSLQAERESLSTPPTPSLSSSGISSIQSNTHEACPTPEVFTGTNRRPLRGSKVKHHGFFGASGFGRSMLMDSEYEPFCTISRSGSSIQVPGSYRIEDPRRRVVDWTHWEPTKFQCNFCQERFLQGFDLRTHLRTHKRYRRLLKEGMRHNDLNSGLDPVHRSTQHLPHASLASDSCTPCSSEHMYSGETRSLGNDLGKGAFVVSSRTKSERDVFSTTPDENADLSAHIHHGREGTTIETAPTSALSLHARRPPPHLQPTKSVVDDPNGILQSYIDFSEDEKEMVGSEDLLDCADTSIFVLEMDGFQEEDNIGGLLMLRSLLVSAKEKLIIQIMDEFMAALKQNWASGTRTHGNAPGETPSNTSQSEPRTLSQVSSSNRRRQYNGEDNNNEGPGDGDDDGDDDDQKAPKRFRASSFTTNSDNKFACPYRKYNPRKYCVQNWRPCALTPLENVARVKFVTRSLPSSVLTKLTDGRAHLYRHHRIFQCQRCKSLFLNQNILDEHILAPEGCVPNRINLAEGITADIEKRLRSRKKTYPHQTEADRWEEIYRMLFSTAIVPSPFFEPVEESVEQVSDSTKLAEFEEYTQKELPRLFWAALEEVVTKEMQPVEERLRTQLMGMIQNCQHQVFSTYQSMANSTLDTLMSDNFTRDRLSNQFEPLSRIPATENQLASANRVASSNNISAFNSSTTLSSIFRSSTTLNSIFTSSATLSSIASSQTSPQIQPAGDLCGEVEGDNGALGADDENIATTDMGQDDFWMTDLEDIDVSKFGVDNMWSTGT